MKSIGSFTVTIMNISVHGCGYLGAVHAAAMATLGHTTVGIDIDSERIAALADGVAPFHEPGFTELLKAALASGRLSFTTDASAAHTARVHFLCVGTPQLPGADAADLSQVDAALDALLDGIAPHPHGPRLVVGKSTVPVGTAEELAARIREQLPDGAGGLLWNPEFLREGFGVKDTLEPDRIVYGIDTDARNMGAVEMLDAVYDSMLQRGTPRIVTDLATAQLVKVSANSFLATKISFINAMSQVCHSVGADVTTLATAIGLDDRIGPKFLGAGIGFGGGCLPKDLHAFTVRAQELGCDESVGLLRSVDRINVRQREWVFELAEQALGGSVTGRRVTVLGATFKPDTDDLRQSPALELAMRLHRAGAQVTVSDPRGLAKVRHQQPELVCVEDPYDAAADAELVVLATEWAEYRNLDPVWLARLVERPVMLDARNTLDVHRWSRCGWDLIGPGRVMSEAKSGEFESEFGDLTPLAAAGSR